ncbi:MAG TPA: hypothetical protein VMO26_05645 [Vicinamibacterales bacterium]|nr:hypothetical protein [Vicinamibacterales bacterium]
MGIVAYGVFCAFVLLLALWGAGNNLDHVAVTPLLLAMVFYGVPFGVVAVRARQLEFWRGDR